MLFEYFSSFLKPKQMNDPSGIYNFVDGLMSSICQCKRSKTQQIITLKRKLHRLKFKISRLEMENEALMVRNQELEPLIQYSQQFKLLNPPPVLLASLPNQNVDTQSLQREIEDLKDRLSSLQKEKLSIETTQNKAIVSLQNEKTSLLQKIKEDNHVERLEKEKHDLEIEKVKEITALTTQLSTLKRNKQISDLSQSRTISNLNSQLQKEKQMHEVTKQTLEQLRSQFEILQKNQVNLTIQVVPSQ